MHRSCFTGVTALAAALLWSAAAGAEGLHWGYEGEAGPERWGELDSESAVCGSGTQQSPIDISGAVRAELPPVVPEWMAGRATVVNNGHTVQVDMPGGSLLHRGATTYELLQFHFHAPSEHLVDGRRVPLEVHFVHRQPETGALGVLGVFLVPGGANPAFAALAAAFPGEEGDEAAVAVDPAGLLPASLAYWAYQGSLTTPPCSEVVDWMVAMEPVEVDAADIDRFTVLYPMNARPPLPANRRFILGSE